MEDDADEVLEVEENPSLDDRQICSSIRMTMKLHHADFFGVRFLCQFIQSLKFEFSVNFWGYEFSSRSFDTVSLTFILSCSVMLVSGVDDVEHDFFFCKNYVGRK